MLLSRARSKIFPFYSNYKSQTDIFRNDLFLMHFENSTIIVFDLLVCANLLFVA
jgi:hypothetical protein